MNVRNNPLKEDKKMNTLCNFERLLAPGKIGNCTIPNRLVVGPMVTNMCTANGYASEQFIRYHEEKARGGFGLIITEDYRTSEHAGAFPNVAGLYDETQVESHKRLTEAVHRHGAKIFAQIYHAGRNGSSKANGGMQSIAASPMPCPRNSEMAREATVPEIKRIVEDFAITATNVKKAGFDGVEIHGAHGYLIHGFLSLNSNKRVDAYGGCYENRIRLLREIMGVVREAVGTDFPIQVRVSAAEESEGGRDSFESHGLFRDIERFGADAIHVTFGMYGPPSSRSGIGSFFQPKGYGARYAAEVKKLVRIPVIAVGSIHDPRLAEDILERGDADFITMARNSLCDPHLPNKLKSGESNDIRPCVRCLQGCTASTHMGIPLFCMVNPELGHEYEYDYSPASVKKKVYVAGGGVAGMEAARAARLKGHNVTLFEASGGLGGQFILASYPPYKGDFAPFPAWQVKQLEKLGANVRLNTELTAEIVKTEKPDKVIVATGAKPVVREYPGIDGPKVVKAEDVLSGKVLTGAKVAVIGGGLIGSETAAYIAATAKVDVALTTRQDDVGGDMEPGIKEDLKALLERSFVKIYLRTSLKAVTADGVLLASEGREWRYDCDTVVTAFGTEAYNPFGDSLANLCEVAVVGDALEARMALEAVHEGFLAGFTA
jgi:2,4-dienoyl-CoA reductase-like NADH-dependent reductase (Old Yellow Enzyme family)/NADPH-dependent 2,4-dienoyl-CoA reductase/sulfur reductase-like enzyme